MNRRAGKRKKRVGIRRRLFVSLALFLALLLVMVWIFLVKLLPYFYEREKFSEIQGIAGELAENLSVEDLETLAKEYAKQHGVCIRIFSINGETAAQIANADMAPDCVIHRLGPQLISDLYDSANANGGQYDKRFEFSKDAAQEEGRFPGFAPIGNSINAIHVRVVEHGESRYLMLLDCELTPVDTIVKTMETQFLWIAGAMLAAAFLMALLLSHFFARPLIAITHRAEKLSGGEFDVTLPRGSYKEVQELAEALGYAAAEIGATGRLQRELIANISHDLRTPLTMIKGYSEIMRDIPGENTPENVQAVIDEATRLSDLVNDLMDLSKLQASTVHPELSVFDLTDLLRDTMQRYDTLIRHKGYRIEFVLQDNAPVCADRTMILQVIYNLINNAVNYTGESMRILVTQTVRDGVVRLAVADDGEGIPPEQIGEIWDRYYRVDREHKRAVMGTGLGLSIVKSILEMHRAHYGVESAVGVGSVFWFELPIAPTQEQ